jgi:hypothetical protein
MSDEMQLVEVGSRKLSVLNTTDDIAYILLKEVTGDEHTGKNALYTITSMFLSQQEDLQTPMLEDLVEYLLIVGNATHRTSTGDIMRYITLKRELHEKKKDLISNRNPKFRKLLQEVILNEQPQEEGSVDPDRLDRYHSERFNRLVDEMNCLYRSVIVGVEKAADSIPSKSRPDIYIPPEVHKAARALLVNFPILQRIELHDYRDIISGIEIDSILTTLNEDYRIQIKDYIENRISQIVEEKAIGSRKNNGFRKCTAQEILLQAKIGTLISRGVAPLTPSISYKHFTTQDFRLALVSACSRIKKPNENFVDRNRIKDLEMRSYFYNYNSRSAYAEYNSRERNSDENMFESYESFQKHIAEVIDSVPSQLSNAEKLIAEKILLSISDHTKGDARDWKKLFNQYTEEISEADLLGFLLLAYSAGVKPHYTVKLLDNKTDIPYDKRKKEEVFQGMTFSKFNSRSPIEERLRKMGRHESDADEYDPCSEGIFVKGDNFADLLHCLVATYVNNRILCQLKDISEYSLQHLLAWNSPLNLSVTYSPEDIAVADGLLKRYPVFSRIPVINPEDLADGIILDTYQKITGDYNIDPSATISQNLMIRQMNSLNRLMEARNDENHQP